MTISVTARDTLMPELLQKLRGMDAGPRREAMAAVGEGLKSMAKRAFNTNPALRPTAWPAKKDGTPSTLQDSTRLRQSVTVTSVSPEHVSIGSDALYARIHQLGGKTKPHDIFPKNGKALAFKSAGYKLFGISSLGGKPVVLKMVRHPGSDIPARPYLPFDANGQPTPQADRLIRTILRAKLGLTEEGSREGLR